MYFVKFFLKWLNNEESTPPNTSTYSLKSLKGTFFSNSNPAPGAIDKKNPKSM